MGPSGQTSGYMDLWHSLKLPVLCHKLLGAGSESCPDAVQVCKQDRFLGREVLYPNDETQYFRCVPSHSVPNPQALYDFATAPV